MKKKDVIIYSGEALEMIDKESNFLLKASAPKKLETKVIKYESTKDTLEIGSMSHILFPFFTSRVKNRDVNLEYHFKDLGMKFFSVLDSDTSMEVKQPAGFEEKIYNFILQKSFEIYELEKEKISKLDLDEEVKDELGKGIINKLEFEFEIPELLEYLGLKKNVTYYKKIEDSLLNMKYTNYRFEKTNSSKYEKNRFDFESLKFSLINYEKLKKGRKTYYKIYPSNLILEKTLKDKQYLYFTSESRRSISKVSSSALRVYRYISMRRFDKGIGEASIESLALIVPYELFSLNKSNGKEYTKSKIKEITKKVLKVFKGLKEEGYIDDYSEIIDQKGKPAIRYVFSNEKLGLITHYTKKQAKNDVKKIEIIEEIKVEEVKKIGKSLKEAIIYSKGNPYVSKVWNKRVDNKINKIVHDTNESYAIYILEYLFDELKEAVPKTLVQYINVILKKKTYEEFLAKKKDGDIKVELLKEAENPKSIEVERVEVVKPIQSIIEVIEEKKKVVKEPKVKNKIESMSNLDDALYSMYLQFEDDKKDSIKKKAKEIYLRDTGVKSFTKLHEKIFLKTEKRHIVRAIKES